MDLIDIDCGVCLWKDFIRVIIRVIQCWGKYGKIRVVGRCQEGSPKQGKRLMKASMNP
jgi:hypothetical protein